MVNSEPLTVLHARPQKFPLGPRGRLREGSLGGQTYHSRALLDLDNLIGHQAMRTAMDLRGHLRVGTSTRQNSLPLPSSNQYWR